jgi:hypothetical protein
MESQQVRFRLHSPVAAVRLTNSGAKDGVFVSLPSGTLTVFLGPSPAKCGMVEIYSKGNYYLVFDEDLCDRAEPLTLQPASF